MRRTISVATVARHARRKPGERVVGSFQRGRCREAQGLPPKNYPSRLERFDRETEMRRGTGGFDVMKVAESTPTKIVLLIQERLGEQFAQFYR